MMDPFDAMWEAARHNAWSGYVPLTLNITTAVLVAVAFIRIGWLRWLLNLVVVLACVAFAIEYSSREIEEKWRLRYEYVEQHRDALTERQQAAGIADGANRTLGPILIGGFGAVARCSMVLVILGVARFVIATIGSSRRTASKAVEEQALGTTTPSDDPNPYSPPVTTSGELSARGDE